MILRMKLRTCIPVAIGFFVASAIADDTPWLRCRSISDATARLACYDAVTPAPTDALKRSAPPAPAKPPAEQFGMENRLSTDALNRVESTVVGRVDGLRPGQIFKLANGQEWQITDDTRVSFLDLQDPKVAIRRGVLGAFYIEFEKSNHSPRVKRIR